MSLSSKTKSILIHGKNPKNLPRGPWLLLNIDTLFAEPGKEPLNGAALLIEKDRIKEVGASAKLRARYRTLPALSAEGFIVLPGLINAHTHVAMGFFRGLGFAKEEMIERFLFPAERSLTAELTGPLSYSYLLDGLRAGVTTFVDHYYFSEGIGLAAERLGCRAFLGETVADLGGAFPGKESWHKAQKLIARWPFSDLIKPVIAPHAADTVSAPLLKEMARFATDHSLPLHMHLAQSPGEVERVQKNHRMSPVAFAEQCGALTPNSLVVHLTRASSADFHILRKSGATAGLCPTSQIIYDRLADVTSLWREHIPVALGTDCAASHDSADLFYDLKLTALMLKDRGYPIKNPAELLRCVTTIPAHVLGAPSLGQLTVGSAADMVFCRRGLQHEPWQNPTSDVIFSLGARDVEHVMVSGKWALWQRAPVATGEDTLRKDFTKAVATIKKRLKVKGLMA